MKVVYGLVVLFYALEICEYFPDVVLVVMAVETAVKKKVRRL